MPQKMRRATPALFAAGAEYLSPDDGILITDSDTELPALIGLIELIFAAPLAPV